MMTSTTKKLVAAGLAAATIAGGLFAGSAAHADPQQLNPTLAGVGSDTTQAVMNALSGFNAGVNYTPINAGSTYSYEYSNTPGKFTDMPSACSREC
jgi:ABC-type phosphate transport system substrate-binding protein